MIKRVYVWEFPVRLTHWCYVLCITLLSISGFYIGAPFIHAAPGDRYIMGWMRFMHFVSAYLFAVSILVRVYWSFAGNKYADWRVFNPFSISRLKELGEITRYYLFLKKGRHGEVGHTACATYVYLGLFVLFVVEALSGFALYSQSHHGIIWTLMGGWLLSVFHAQTLRLFHHLIMWLFIAFTISHVYLAWYSETLEKNGILMSIFNGYKTVEEE